MKSIKRKWLVQRTLAKNKTLDSNDARVEKRIKQGRDWGDLFILGRKGNRIRYAMSKY